MAIDFKTLLDNDVKEVFLKGEFSQSAILKSGSNISTITIQFFEDSLDKLGTTYHHAWCAFVDAPYVKKNDTLLIEGITYGIVDFSPDEFNTGMNLFIQEV